MNSNRYKNWYASLIKLYPKTYREDFAEPMLVTFSDLCDERLKRGEKITFFVFGLFAETSANIIKEIIREGMMKKPSKKVSIIVVAGILLVSILLTFVLRKGGDGIIPRMATLNQARTIASKSKTESCVATTSDESVKTRVRNDDKMIGSSPEFGEFWNLELEIASAISDVPAGTAADVTYSSYDGKVVKGSILYDGNYGTYNYVTEKLEGNGNWQLQYIKACKR